jgi:YHS domain-containing protein
LVGCPEKTTFFCEKKSHNDGIVIAKTFITISIFPFTHCEEKSMKRGLESSVLRGYLVFSFVLAIGFTVPALNAAGNSANESGMVSVDNAIDPICGMKVSKVPEANIAKYKGKTIGFCSGYCLKTWNKLSNEEKDKKISSTMAGGNAPSIKNDYRTLPKPGGKIPLGGDHYFTYGFTSPPKLGSAIMKVDIFTSDGTRDATFRVSGDLDMPSMRGAHSTGNRDFAVSAKGFYLLPVRLVMPGDWEMRLMFEKDGASVLSGAYLFDL